MKRLIVIIFILFGAFLAFSLYRTYAYDTSVVEETPSTTDLEYTFKIGNSSIKQITVDSGEIKYYDVVLGNPNPAKISYGVYYEMVSPSSKPDNFSIEYTSKSTGESTGKIDKEGNITLNLVVTNTNSSAVTVKIGSVAGYVNGGELILGSGQVLVPQKPIPKATELVEELNDNSTGDSGSGVYKVHHDAIPADSSAIGEIIPAVDDYRYYGANPNNYICLDMEEQSTCPDRGLYRIIGSIYDDIEEKNRLKVIKASPFVEGDTTTFLWNNGYGNMWATKIDDEGDGSTILNVFNNEFFDVSNLYALSAITQNYIERSVFFLGGWNDVNVYTNDIYCYERGTTTPITIGDEYPLFWLGKVGLMYPSDYGYAAGNNCVTGTVLLDYDVECSDKDWLFNGNEEWLISPNSDDKENVFVLTESGFIELNGYVDSVDLSMRPVFYLTSDVLITSGTGTSSDPYLVSK